MEDILIRRIRGCLFGLALGEAIGRPAGLSPQDNRNRHGWIVDLLPVPEDHPIHLPGPAGLIGPITRRVLKPENPGGGSSLAAGVAAGLAHPGDAAAAVEGCARFLTEGEMNSLVCAGAGAVAAAVASVLGGCEDYESIVGAAQQGAFRGQRLGARVITPSISYRLQYAQSLLASKLGVPERLQELFDLVGSEDRPHEAPVAALAILGLAGMDPATGIVYSANLGGRADLVGALVGAIAGGAHEETAFPAAWVALINQVNPAITQSLGGLPGGLRDQSTP